MAQKKKTADRSSPFKRSSAIIGLIGGIIAVTLGGWKIINQVRATREVREKVSMYLSVGDRFAAQMEHGQAIEEYRKVLEIDKSNVEAHRRIITSTRETLVLAAEFGDNQVPDADINGALTPIYQLQSLKPELKDDVGLLLDEALILKTRENRSSEAIKVLEIAHKLSPENPEVLAELGFLRALYSNILRRRIEGLDLIRLAIELRPNEARYHFYLARSLDEVYLCPYAGLDQSISGDAEGCAEAIRAYHRAADVATAQDFWAREIRRRATRRSIDIFHRYARKEKDILTPNLGMPFDERLKELEYLLISETPRSSTGQVDNPQFWLATLYHATGNLGKAERLMRELLVTDPYWERRLIWLELYAKILEESGQDGSTPAKIEALINNAKGASERN